MTERRMGRPAGTRSPEELARLLEVIRTWHDAGALLRRVSSAAHPDPVTQKLFKKTGEADWMQGARSAAAETVQGVRRGSEHRATQQTTRLASF